MQYFTEIINNKKGIKVMKNQNGITLTSLVIYVIVMIMVIGVMTSISAMFYNNTENLNEDTKDMVEFNNFNNYFVKEIKSANNKVNSIAEDGTYILFDTGNSFSFKNNTIFYNDLEIARNVNNTNFNYYINSEGKEEKDVIAVNIEFNNYSKQINYKVEEIY